MKSVMNHNFSQVPKVEIPRSSFDRSHGYKTTFNADYLVPFCVDEVLPGDTFNVNANIFARLATPQTPFMDNMFLDTFWFFVPNRIIWDNFQRFMGEQDNPGDTTDYEVPIVTGNLQPLSVGDYMGLPLPDPVTNTVTAGDTISALPLRCYNKIYFDWFKDQNLISSPKISKDDGPDLFSETPLRKRCKKHDYFTSCLPWPQKGDEVFLPLGISAPVIGNGMTIGLDTNAVPRGLTAAFGSGTYFAALGVSASGYGQPAKSSFAPTTSVDLSEKTIGLTTDPDYSGMIADLSDATAATINELREAFAIQRLMERDARGGSRYVELLKAHFQVTSPDFRLMRSEYLGGSSTPISINPVQQTSSTDATTPQGNLAAFGTARETRSGFTKSFVEHGWIIGLVNVRADLTYSQGMQKMWQRRTKLDHYWPALANLGEQEVKSGEIFYELAGGSTPNPDNELTFGFQERYAEYRYKPSQLTGLMRPTAANSLDVWHLSEEFATRPELNDDFIVSNTPVERVIAIETEPHFIMDSYIQMKCARPMPMYSVPGLIDHF